MGEVETVLGVQTVLRVLEGFPGTIIDIKLPVFFHLPVRACMKCGHGCLTVNREGRYFHEHCLNA